MSKSLNSIKQRRAVAQPMGIQNSPSQGRFNPQVSPPTMQQQQQQTQSVTPPAPPATGLTLPQVIALIDTRLVTLERFMTETKSSPPQNSYTPPAAPILAPSQTQPQEEGLYVTSDEFSENMVEFDNRFQLLVTEIANLKDIVLSLQKYTMDVNKMLLESQMETESSNNAESSSDLQENVHFIMSTAPSSEEEPASSVDA